MNIQNKKIVSLISVIIILLGLTVLAKPKTSTLIAPLLGNIGSRSLRLTKSAAATTTQTFLATDIQGPTATTTLLTLGCDSNSVLAQPSIEDTDSIGLYVQVTATTTATAVVNIQPQVSNDCVDWYGMGGLYDQVSTAGTAINVFTSPKASSTYLAIVPNERGTTFHQFVLRNLAAKAIRFRAWGQTATSTVWIQTAEVNRITR